MRGSLLPVACTGLLALGCSDSPVADCVDDGCACDPQVDAFLSCYDGDAAEVGVGQCVKGTRTCDPDTGAWGVCVDQINAESESCDAVDNDCDGTIDEGLVDCEPLIHYPGACADVQDNGIDSTADVRSTFIYDSRGLVVEQMQDDGADGTDDHRWAYMRGGEDGRVLVRHQFNAAGTLVAVLDYAYDDKGRLAQLLHDTNNDGVHDASHAFTYSAGLQLFETIDVGINGTVEERWTNVYDDARLLSRRFREVAGAVNYTIDYQWDAAANLVIYEHDANVDGTRDIRNTLDYSCW